MKSTLLILLGFLVLSDAWAQYEAPGFHRLDVHVGPQQTKLVDEQFSPVVHSARELGLRIGYQSGIRRHLLDVSLDLAGGELYPKAWSDRWLYNSTEDLYGEVTTDSILLRGRTRTVTLQAGYSYAIRSTPRGSFSLGLAVRNQLMYPKSFTNMGIMNSASLVATARATRQAGTRWLISGEIMLPVIGFNTRFPYSGTVSRPNQSLFEAFFDGGTRFVSLDKYQQVQASASLQFNVSSGLAIGLRYDFQYQQYLVDAPLRSFSQRLGLAFTFTL